MLPTASEGLPAIVPLGLAGTKAPGWLRAVRDASASLPPVGLIVRMPAC